MSATTDRRQKLFEWIDERTNIKEIWYDLMYEEIPGGARWAYIFGSGLIFVFSQQLITGILLLLYYAPTIDHAHASVEYIQKQVLLGNFIRGLHFYGSSAMVILVFVHLLQVFFWGAYKKKRELLWMVGVLLLLLVLGFSFTGYLLPWDQKAYFGTKVGVSIMSSMPVIGSWLERVVLGGETLSTLTLSRFFVVHVLILPLSIMGFIAVHLYLFRVKGAAGPYKEESVTFTEYFYPRQFFRDCAFALVLFVLIAALSHFIPAPLEPKADPSDANYIARPEWYFLPLFQLLKYFSGKLVIVGTVIIPGLIFTALFLVPFLDRSPQRNPFKRPIATSIISCAMLAIIALMLLSYKDDRSDPSVKTQLDAQAKEAKEFFNEPFKPQTIGGKVVASQSAAPVPRIFADRCAVCHGDAGEGGGLGPSLQNLAKKDRRTHDDIIKLLKDPASYGLQPPMQSFKDLSDKEYKDLADWIMSLK